MKVSLYSNIGKRRRSNQDYADSYQSLKGQSLLILCDGVGGHQGGDIASQMTTEFIGTRFETLDKVLELETSKQWMATTIAAANEHVNIAAKQDETLAGMATTLVLALILDKDQAAIAHLGDSRAYQYAHNQLTQLTQDHSLVNELINSGELSKDEAENHPQKNIVTRSIGGGGMVDVTPDFTEINLNEIDMLMLCSDGLTNMVDEETMNKLFDQYWQSDELGNHLIEAANQAGGDDNITIALASCFDTTSYSKEEN